MGCNEDKAEINNGFLINKNIEMHLSDSTLKDLDGIIAAGGGGAAIYWALVEKGIITTALVSSTTGAAIGGAIAVYWGMITIQNNGCGVILKQRIPLGNVAPTVHSQ